MAEHLADAERIREAITLRVEPNSYSIWWSGELIGWLVGGYGTYSVFDNREAAISIAFHATDLESALAQAKDLTVKRLADALSSAERAIERW